MLYSSGLLSLRLTRLMHKLKGFLMILTFMINKALNDDNIIQTIIHKDGYFGKVSVDYQIMFCKLGNMLIEKILHDQTIKFTSLITRNKNKPFLGRTISDGKEYITY